MVKKRKHISEFSLGLFSKGTLVLHPKDIDRFDDQNPETKALAERCNIYLIGKRKRLAYVPDSVRLEHNSIIGMFSYTNEGECKSVDFRFDGSTVVDEVEVSPYPHSKIVLRSKGEVAGIFPAYIASFMCHYIQDPSLRDVEIVYVGMSYGAGSRSAKDRLQSHSTLQKVLADMNHDFPEDEALVLMIEYGDPQYFVTFDGSDKSLSLEGDRNVTDDIRENRKRLSRKLEICLAEAGLIRYFQPAYNKTYKKTFPSHSQNILRELYRSDMGALSVELNTEDLYLRTFSAVRKCGLHHIAHYDLFDVKSRASFFSLGAVDSGIQLKDMSGPVY